MVLHGPGTICRNRYCSYCDIDLKNRQENLKSRSEIISMPSRLSTRNNLKNNFERAAKDLKNYENDLKNSLKNVSSSRSVNSSQKGKNYL